jgi:hypothetical protein
MNKAPPTQEQGPSLATEMKTFDARRSDLERTYFGKFVVVKGEEVIGAWDTLGAAADEAVRRFGRGPYLIRQVGAPPVTLPASVLFRVSSPQLNAHN